MVQQKQNDNDEKKKKEEIGREKLNRTPKREKPNSTSIDGIVEVGKKWTNK